MNQKQLINQNHNNFFENSYDFLYEDLLNQELNDQLDFLKHDIKSNTKALDFCCGTGRHLIPLNQNGLDVSGVDINKKCISDLKTKVKTKKLNAKLYQSDVQNFKSNEKFDYVYSIESSIGYTSDEKTRNILKNVSNLLNDNGTFVIHLINKNFLIRNMSRQIWFEKGVNSFLMENRIINPLDGTITLNQTRIIDGDVSKHTIDLRLYSLQEIKFLMEKTGLRIKNVVGDFNRNAYTQNSPYMIIEAEKEVI